MICRACQHEHPRMLGCTVARRLREAAERKEDHPAVVVHTVVHPAVVVHAPRHGKHAQASADKRRAYRREWMKRYRAAKAG